MKSRKRRMEIHALLRAKKRYAVHLFMNDIRNMKTRIMNGEAKRLKVTQTGGIVYKLEYGGVDFYPVFSPELGVIRTFQHPPFMRGMSWRQLNR